MEVKFFDKLTRQFIDAEIIEADTKNLLIKSAKMMVNGHEVGRMLYFLAKSHLDIQMLYNDQRSRYALVGTAFVDYAFEKSIKNGKEGRIHLGPVPSSVPFWTKMGFQFRSENEMHLSSAVIHAKINSEEYKQKQVKDWAKEHGFLYRSFDEPAGQHNHRDVTNKMKKS